MKKIAITGHTSGIGYSIDAILSLTYNKADINIRGYSRRNGYNLAEQDGNKVIDALLEYDPDVVFNNAYYPKVQNKILKVLYKEWADREKVIINTGSISGYLSGVYQDGKESYVSDKKELAQECVANSFNYPGINKTRVHCVSFGFVDTALLTPRSGQTINKQNMIDCDEAALILIDLMEEKPYYIAEQVINSRYNTASEATDNYLLAYKNMIKHIATSRRAAKNT